MIVIGVAHLTSRVILILRWEIVRKHSSRVLVMVNNLQIITAWVPVSKRPACLCMVTRLGMTSIIVVTEMCNVIVVVGD